MDVGTLCHIWGEGGPKWSRLKRDDSKSGGKTVGRSGFERAILTGQAGVGPILYTPFNLLHEALAEPSLLVLPPLNLFYTYHG
jgi:hypothetical protein